MNMYIYKHSVTDPFSEYTVIHFEVYNITKHKCQVKYTHTTKMK